MANTAGDWFNRYWLVLLVVGLVILGFIAWAVFPTADKGALKVLKEAEEGVKKMKAEKSKELEVLIEEMEEHIDTLMEIKSIKDEDERLQRLADFGNKRKKRAAA